MEQKATGDARERVIMALGQITPDRSRDSVGPLMATILGFLGGFAFGFFYFIIAAGTGLGS